jgi:YVTN family beta-propeller protein
VAIVRAAGRRPSLAYMTNMGSNTVAVIDKTTNKFKDTIGAYPSPVRVCIDRDFRVPSVWPLLRTGSGSTSRIMPRIGVGDRYHHDPQQDGRGWPISPG